MFTQFAIPLKNRPKQPKKTVGGWTRLSCPAYNCCTFVSPSVTPATRTLVSLFARFFGFLCSALSSLCGVHFFLSWSAPTDFATTLFKRTHTHTHTRTAWYFETRLSLSDHPCLNKRRRREFDLAPLGRPLGGG